MKILVLSKEPWNTSNSFGNTFENLFDGVNNVEIANIYCSEGDPNSKLVSRYFQINEKILVEKILHIHSNTQASMDDIVGEEDYTDKFTYRFFSRYKSELLFIIREIFWKIIPWRFMNIDPFIKDFNPDILYIPVYNQIYMIDIALHIKKVTNKPMVCHITDDIYSYMPGIRDPFYYIRKYIIRKKIERIISLCNFIDTFTELQKTVYERLFNKECKIRWKHANIDENNQLKYLPKEQSNIINIVYTGNIGGGRWNTLMEFANIFESDNAKREEKILLSIYSANILNDKMRKQVEALKFTRFLGKIRSDEVNRVQMEADILLFVESLDEKESKSAWLSFSTKIIDYLSVQKPVIAIGYSNLASMQYLKTNEIALVASSHKDIVDIVSKIHNNKKVLHDIVDRATFVIKKNHNKMHLQNRFYNDLKCLFDAK